MSRSYDTKSDTTIIRQIVRDTTVVVKSDSSMLQALIECDSLGQAHLRQLMDYRAGEYLRPPQVVLKDNILTVTANADSLKFRISWLEREIYNVKNSTYIEYCNVPIKYVTWWQKLWMTLGKILSAITLLIIIYKLIKRNYNGK